MVTLEQTTKAVLNEALKEVNNAVVWYGDARRNYADNMTEQLSQKVDSRLRDVDRCLGRLVDAAKAYGAWHANKPADVSPPQPRPARQALTVVVDAPGVMVTVDGDTVRVYKGAGT